MSRRGKISIQPGQEHRGTLVRLIEKAAYDSAPWRVWDDLMYMSAAAISQPLRWVQEREDEYLRRINGYDKDKQPLFPEMFKAIVAALEHEGHADLLGAIYMQLELGNHWKGQFFSPYNLALCMAQMQATTVAQEVEAEGYITVNDPCCGGGAMLIAFAQACKEQGVNYQESVLFVAQDIDPVAARMCYIQMSLYGMPGYVIIGNSLKHPPTVPLPIDYEIWHTPFYFMGGWQWRRQRDKPLVLPTPANDNFTGQGEQKRLFEVG